MFKTPYISKEYVVVSENSFATLNGVNIISNGGNAADAAVSVAFTLALTIPHLGGFGGDFFALYYDSSRDMVFCLNGSGYAGKYQSIDNLLGKGFKDMPMRGIYSISLPGFVDGVYNLWKKFGSMSWKELLGNPYKMGIEGFPISYTLSHALKIYGDNLSKDHGSRETYHLGRSFKPGDIISFKNISKLIGVLMDDPRSFYEGSVSESILKYLNRYDEVFDEKDFSNYKAEWVEPINIEYEDFLVYEIPPNSQGITTLHVLKLLEGKLDNVSPSSWERIGTFLKVFETAYLIRDKYVSDPKFMKMSVDDLLLEDFLLKFRDVRTLHASKNLGGDTTYFSIVDREGNIVSGVQSLFYPFGSFITEPLFGVTLNCRASSFTFDQNHVNCLQPGKKPLHTLSTPILINKDKVIAHGLSGGHYRPQLHAEILTNMLVYNMDPQEALEYPRFLWDSSNDKIVVEEGYSLPSSKSQKIIVKRYGSRLGVAASSVLYSNGLKGGYVDIRGEGIAFGGL